MRKSHQSDSWIRDRGLAQEGEAMIRIAREDMPALIALVKKYSKTQPLKGTRIAVCVIPTAETGNLVWGLITLGAEVRLCSDNVISVDDRVAAAIDSWGVSVFGRRDQTREEFFQCIHWATQFKDNRGKTTPPTQIIDDGSDLTSLIHREKLSWLDKILVVTEQTTCGINFDRALQQKHQLKVPVVDINTGLKAAFDNRYGPRESFIPAFKMCKDIQIGGKLALVAGYGMVGKGVVEALQMMGCRVLVSECDPIRATEALMNGLEIVSVDQNLKSVDIFITATSCPWILSAKQILSMKRGAILCNMGENREYDAHLLVNIKGVVRQQINPNLTRYRYRNWYIDSLCDGYLLNMRSGGNGSRVLGITFALHLIAQIKVTQGWRPKRGIITQLSPEVENEVALLNFPELKNKITRLTPAQKDYMGLS